MRLFPATRKTIGLGLVAFVLGFSASAQSDPVQYYVQLIRGTEQSSSPVAGAHKVGPKLEHQFRRAFKNKAYWEIKCRRISITPGQSSRIALDDTHEVEVSLTHKKRTVTTLFKGRAIDRTQIPRGEGMTMIGAGQEKADILFIVVRRDKPGS